MVFGSKEYKALYKDIIISVGEYDLGGCVKKNEEGSKLYKLGGIYNSKY